MSDTSATYAIDGRNLVKRLAALFEPDCSLCADTRLRLACLDAWYALEPERWVAALAAQCERAQDEDAVSEICAGLLRDAARLHALCTAEAALLQSTAPDAAAILQRIPYAHAVPDDLRDAIAWFFPATLADFAPVSARMQVLAERLQARLADFESRCNGPVCDGKSARDKLAQLVGRIANARAQSGEYEKRCLEYVDRMEYAPILSSTSFDRWRRQRVKVRHKLVERQEQLETDLAKYAAAADCLDSIAATLAALAVLDEPVQAPAAGDLLARLRSDWPACAERIARPVAQRMMDEIENAATRLAVVQAAVPSMPEDWSKPTGTLLALLLLAILADVAWGTLATQQSIATIYDASDAASQVFRYTYIVPILYLIVGACLAARAVPQACAAQCRQRLEAIRAGRTLPEKSALVQTFSRTLAVHLTVAAVAIVGLSGAAWQLGWNNRAGAAPGADLTCSADRFVIYGKGAVVIPVKGEPYTFPDKKLDAALCKKAKDEKPLVATPLPPTKIVFSAVDPPTTPPPPAFKSPLAVRLVASGACDPRTNALPCLLRDIQTQLTDLGKQQQDAENARKSAERNAQAALDHIQASTQPLPEAAKSLREIANKKAWNSFGIGHLSSDTP